MVSLFHPEGVEQRGGAPFLVRDAAEATMDALRSLFAQTYHCVTQSIVDLEGARGVSESYYFSRLVTPPGRESLEAVFGVDHAAEIARSGEPDGPYEIVSGGRYLSSYERRDGSWRFTHRLVVTEWNQVGPVTGRYAGGVLGGLNLSARRDGTDPVYRLSSGGGDR